LLGFASAERAPRSRPLAKLLVFDHPLELAQRPPHVT
jgi:hypothetical protein